MKTHVYMLDTTVVLPPVCSGCAVLGVAAGRVAQPEVATERVLVDIYDERCAAWRRARVVIAT